MSKTLLVFDLDGTLVTTRAGRHAFNQALALGTGNVVEGARLKLEPHALNHFFPTGGFGEDGATRDEVIATAIARSEALHGGKFGRVLVIGDTPHDIACGKANRCFTVGVATGYHSQEQLRQCEADLVLPDFTAVHEVLLRFCNL